MGGRPLQLIAFAVALLVGVGGLASSALTPPLESVITVDAAAEGSPFPRNLLGTAQHPVSEAVLAQVAPARVPHMRVDAYFDRAAPAPGVFDWREMDFRLGRMTASGAEPLLVLAYMPEWLSACPDEAVVAAAPAIEHVEPRFCPPSDHDAWRGVVRAGVEYAATRWGVRSFEVWNEPDNPGFWRGTLADYLALYESTAAGVADAERELGLDLRLGGPATLFANPVWIGATLAHAKAKGLPVDFVSYHWYADYPLHGPVGPLPGTVVTRNPALMARTFGDHAKLVRAWTDAAGFPDAEVWLNEWNVNSGAAPHALGPIGAAFVAASVREMQRSGVLDRANFFTTEHDVWGLFGTDGRPRPTWLALRALLALGDVALPVAEVGAPTVGAIAARDGDSLRAVVYHFDPQTDAPATVRLVLDGLDAGARVELHDLDGRLWAAWPYPADGLVFDLPDLMVLRVGARLPES